MQWYVPVLHTGYILQTAKWAIIYYICAKYIKYLKESQYVPVYIQTTSREKPDGLYVWNVYIIK